MHCLSVEFVPRRELKRQDRELLAALGHPQGRGLASPIFRVIRPGFHPWFVNAEEARILAECIRSVVVVCAAIANQKDANFWDSDDTYPVVTRADIAEPRYIIDLFKPVLPAQPFVASVNLPEELLRPLRRRDYAVRGAMELEYVFSGTAPMSARPALRLLWRSMQTQALFMRRRRPTQACRLPRRWPASFSKQFRATACFPVKFVCAVRNTPRVLGR